MKPQTWKLSRTPRTKIRGMPTSCPKPSLNWLSRLMNVSTPVASRNGNFSYASHQAGAGGHVPPGT